MTETTHGIYISALTGLTLVGKVPLLMRSLSGGMGGFLPGTTCLVGNWTVAVVRKGKGDGTQDPTGGVGQASSFARIF